jgi:antitoxin ParD1/3/4
MPTSYTIGAHFEKLIRQLVDGGRYSTASEVVREGLRLIEEREERRMAKLGALRAEIDKGIASGPPEAVGVSELISDAKARGRRQRAASGHGG